MTCLYEYSGGLASNIADRIVRLLSAVPVKPLGTTGILYSNPIPDSAGALNSAGILGWCIPALLGASPLYAQQAVVSGRD